MSKYQIEYSSDGCPNDCGYCRDFKIACVYTEEGKIRKHTCVGCGKKLSDDEAYQYRDMYFCEECIEL